MQVAPCNSVQVALCKLLCVSCPAQVAPGKVLCANWSVQVALRKLLFANWSAQVALRKLLYASCSVQLAKPARGPGENRTRAPPVPGAQLEQQKLQNNLEFLRLEQPIPAEPRQSPKRVARAKTKSQKTSSFCTATTPIPAECRFSVSVVGTTPPP